MVLSGNDIRQYMKYGGLVITPELDEEQFQQNGIDLCLHSTQLIRTGRDLSFFLASTTSRFEMPNDLMADVALRSTMGRRGFYMPNTKIDAGFKGTITFEIWCWKDMVPPLGEGFAHIVFYKLSTPSKPYSGKYQNQDGITGPR